MLLWVFFICLYSWKGLTRSMVGTHTIEMSNNTRITDVWKGIKSLSLSLGSDCSPNPKAIMIIVDTIDGADRPAWSVTGASQSVSHLMMIRRSMKPKSDRSNTI